MNAQREPPALARIPPTTMLADLDASLRTLLRAELERTGFDRVEIAFEAPTKDWSGQLSSPTLNVFLYDLRESLQHRQRTIDERRNGTSAHQARPPLVLDVSYAVTAWTKDVEDEHRLLSQALGILYAFPKLPDEVLEGRLRDGSQRYPIVGRVGQARGEGKADFWTAVGGQYKASLDYVVMLSCEPGAFVERGPQVREQVIRVRDREGPPGAVVELHRVGGTVVDGDGAPCADAWVRLPETGRWTSTDPDGRFRLERVPPGTHQCVVRAHDGAEGKAELVVPGPGVDLVVGARASRRAAKR